jgi:hypothetical protein
MLQIKWGILLKHQADTNKQTSCLQQHKKAWRMHTIKQLKTRKGNKDQRPQSSLKIRLASLSFMVKLHIPQPSARKNDRRHHLVK